MKKKKHIIFYAILLSIVYLLLRNYLFQIDETPRWAEMKHPEIVAVEKPFEVIVKYHDLDIPSRLLLTVVFTDKHGSYLSEKHLTDNIPVIYDKGESRFKTIITAVDLKRKDISSIRIIANRHEFLNINISIYKCKIIGKSISSQLIPVVDPNADGTLPKKKAIPFSLIIEKAIKEGYWIRYAGDFTFTGWFITAIYFIVFLLCILYLSKLNKNPAKHEKPYVHFRIFLTGCIFLLGLNKQIDIQLLITDIGRTYSQAHGWYETRKYFQVEFLAVFSTIGLGLFFILCKALKNIWRSVFLPVTGLFILFSFVIIKASSLHILEHYFDKRIGGFNLFDISELTGLLCIGLSLIITDRRFNLNQGK
jgi:hypothetical protein